MLIDFNDFLARNLFPNKYLKPIFRKNLYLFLFGLSFTVGDFKLIFATAIFILSMVGSYQYNIRSLNYFVHKIQKILSFNDTKLVSSIGVAGLISIFIYFSLNLYGQLDNLWLVLFIITQTLFSGLGIVFFSKKLFSVQSNNQKKLQLNFNQLVQQLEHESALHRLWVINQIIDLWEKNHLTSIQVNQLEEYLILLQNVELEPIILDKINCSLQKISITNSQLLNLPRQNKTSTRKNR